MDKQDKYIKAQIQQDKEISNKANEIFQKFERRIEMEENNKPKEKKIIKISLQHAVLAFTSLMIVVVLGGNLYAHIKGKPNIYSAIKGLFVKEDKYAASEIVVDQTVESNGIKLTLKTVAMDENILITKYIAQGEKLANKFYAYQEFEQDVIELVKINLKLADWNIMKDDPEYKDVTSKDAVTQAQLISKRLSIANLTEAEEEALMKIAKKAYQEFIVLELSPENSSEKKVNELIEETIAMFESKVNSKYDVMSADTKLQEFGIQTISQKVEKSGNEYIIYNVYNVDTISDLASKFNLSVNVNKIGNIEGKWNFNTELEKARLDTRVETIDFYENNSCDNVAPTITVADGVRHSATVEAKKLVMSDFSTVLMIQTRVADENRACYLEYANDGLPCIFVVTDENGNVVGTGTCSTINYTIAVNAGGRLLYTDRIILENVTKDTKKLYVKIYEQYNMDGETIKVNNEVIELDIEAARNYNRPVELTQNYTSKKVQVSFKYPVDWKIGEEKEYENKNASLKMDGPEDIDGNIPTINVTKYLKGNTQFDLEELVTIGGAVKEEGEITIADKKGIYKEYHYGDQGVNYWSKRIAVEEDGKYFLFNFTTTDETQYARYEETFNKVLETIEFLEAEKSYRTFSNGLYETIKLYEDNAMTISIAKERVELFKEMQNAEGAAKINAYQEYTISGVPENIREVKILYASHDLYELPMIYVVGADEGLYCVDRDTFYKTGEFKIIEIKELKDAYISTIENKWTNDEAWAYFAATWIELGLHEVCTVSGEVYGINPNNMEVRKYIEPEQPDENNQEQTQQEITDAQAKEVIQKYLTISGTYEGDPIEMLKYHMPSYLTSAIDYGDTITENRISYINTNASYDDFKKEMLNYMTEELFVQYFSKWKFKNVNGNLYVANVGASGMIYEVIEIERMNRNGEEFGYNVYVNSTHGDSTKQETFYFKLLNIDGKMIVTFLGVG